MFPMKILTNATALNYGNRQPGMSINWYEDVLPRSFMRQINCLVLIIYNQLVGYSPTGLCQEAKGY
jgi:hypothetical protein